MTTQAKRPDELTFGVEIEIARTGAGPRDCFNAMRAAGITCEWHDRPHSPRANPASWVCTTDGSCGGEIVSPILKGADGYAQIERVSAALIAAGAKVDRSCGLHVHVGARNVLTIGHVQNIAKMFLRHEAAFDEILAPSRRAGANRFCQRNAAAGSGTLAQKLAALGECRTIERIAGVMNGGFQPSNTYTHYRYFSLNFQAWIRNTTIEFRQHSGTVEARKIIEWVKLFTGFVSRATMIDEVANDATPATLDELLRKTDAAGRIFYKQRAQEFAARLARPQRRAA